MQAIADVTPSKYKPHPDLFCQDSTLYVTVEQKEATGCSRRKNKQVSTHESAETP